MYLRACLKLSIGVFSWISTLIEALFVCVWVLFGDGGVGRFVAFCFVLALVGEGVRGRGSVQGSISLDSLLVRLVGAIFGWIGAVFRVDVVLVLWPPAPRPPGSVCTGQEPLRLLFEQQWDETGFWQVVA